jgi:hypothetical protein
LQKPPAFFVLPLYPALPKTAMSKKKQKHQQPPTEPTAVEQPSFFSNAVLLGMTAVLAGLLGYAGWQYSNDGPEPRPTLAETIPPANSPASTSIPAAAPATPAEPGQAQALRGKWVRTDSDGNYVLEIKNIAANGKLEAAYLNPNPINVAKAEATTVAGELRVFVELRDVNYPGSTYDLRYDPASDQLVGEYFTPAQQQRFQVDFVRNK